jgi:hypothetical protein
MGDAQRLGAVKGEIERMQQLQSMLDDGYMALELLDEVRCPLSHRGLGSRDASLKKRNGVDPVIRRRTSRFCRRRRASQRASSLGSTNGRPSASLVQPPAPRRARSLR